MRVKEVAAVISKQATPDEKSGKAHRGSFYHKTTDCPRSVDATFAIAACRARLNLV
jgi:hypothetical protein